MRNDELRERVEKLLTYASTAGNSTRYGYTNYREFVAEDDMQRGN